LNFDEELLKDDIDGILVELKDKGFEITISIFKTMGRDNKYYFTQRS
jgi:hypothetical protein